MSPPELERAKAMALKMLAQRARSEAEVRRKLERASFPAEVVAEAISFLKHMRYLDDAAYAAARAESLLAKGRLGPAAVAQRLTAKGVTDEEAERAIAQAAGGTSEEQLAREALAKRYPGVDSRAPREVKARAARFLGGRGFSEAAVEALLGDLTADD